MTRTLKLAVGSLLVGVLVLGLKFLAYWVTGSIALFSDALESTVNVATAVAALLAVRLAAQPADARHPFGHHKVEYFSAVAEGVLIVLAAILILREAFDGLVHPRMIAAPFQGLLLTALASAINGIWCWVLIAQGRKLRSPALVADGWHLFTDVVSSAAVIVGLLLAIATGWTVLDPALAILVALNILWAGWRVLKESVGGLMDEAVPERTLSRIREVISAHAQGALEAHDIRTRHAGRATFIEFHLVVPGGMSVSDAHEICDRIENALKADTEDAFVTIHVEPEDKAKHTGVVVL
jgi:cation diffusion facilitator family transporter